MPLNKLPKKPKIFIPLILIALIGLTIFTYVSCLASGLVEWDDQFQITQNLDIKQLDVHSLKKFFSNFYLGMYQPLTTLSFALEYKFWHSAPPWLHLDNLLLHLLNIILVYWLTVRLFGRRLIALIAASLFAINPLNVETVAWVSARSNLLAGTFFLGSVLAYTFYQRKPKPTAYCLALGFFLASLFSKVAGVALPVIIIVLDYYRGRRFTKLVWLEKLPFFVISIIFGLIAIQSRGLASLLPATAYTWWHKLLFVPYSFIFYLKKLILPINLSSYYGFPELDNGWLPTIYQLSAIIFIILLIFLWRYRANKLWLWLSAWFCLLIAPTLQVKIFSTTITADRYAYLAGLAYFWALGLLLVWLWDKFKRLRVWLIFFLISFVLLFACLARIRTWVWFDSWSLWNDVIKQDPKIASVYNNMGNAESGQGNLDKALEYYNKALALDPKDPFTYNNIGSAIVKNHGDNLKALNYYNQAIKLNSREPLSYYNRGNVWFNLKETKAALLDYQQAVNLSPANNEYYYLYVGSLARAQYEMNLLPEAIASYNKAIDLYAFNLAYYYRGLAKIKLRQTVDGCQDLRTADSLKYQEAAEALKKYCANN